MRGVHLPVFITFFVNSLTEAKEKLGITVEAPVAIPSMPCNKSTGTFAGK
jgi:hypothetical protein